MTLLKKIKNYFYEREVKKEEESKKEVDGERETWWEKNILRIYEKFWSVFF